MEAIEGKAKEITASLGVLVIKAVEKYLLALKDEQVIDLYRLVLEEIEAPLYKAVMEHCRYNQSRAAILLGISRGTLRKMLSYYYGDQYIGTRD